jgi:hypothetical protein
MADPLPPPGPSKAVSSPASSPLSLPKAQAIRAACERRDIPALVDLAQSPGGFLDDELRVLACTFALDGHCVADLDLQGRYCLDATTTRTPTA